MSHDLDSAPAPQWFANRVAVLGSASPNLGFDAKVFARLSPRLAMVLDSALLRLRAVTTNNRTSVKNVITIIGDIIRDAYSLFVRDANGDIDPVATKAAIMLMVDDFYSKVVAPLDIPYIPAFLENSFVDPAIGKIVHEIAESFYDLIVSSLQAIPPQMIPVGSETPEAYAHRNTQSDKALAPNPTELDAYDEADKGRHG